MISMFSYMNDDFLSESSYDKMATIDLCHRALLEDSATSYIVNIATSYTHSLFYEILDNMKEYLTQLYQRVLSVLNNYILNSANLIEKYRNIIIDRYEKLSTPLVYETYEYDLLKSKDYPRIIKPGDNTKLEQAISALQNSIIDNNLTQSDIDDQVDKLLISFSQDIIELRADPMELRESVKALVSQRLRGRRVQKTLNRKDLNEFIDELKKYQEMKNDLLKTKKTMLADYETLKKTYMKFMSDKEASSTALSSMKDPMTEKLKATEYNRFANINMSLTRLFNGFITIYSSAFDTKLNVLKEHIENNKKLIDELMVRTNVFTAINPRSSDKAKRKPTVFKPDEIKL